MPEVSKAHKARARDRLPCLSGYKIMWQIVMFDLPVTTKKERRAATIFRKKLLDMGYDMAQFSIYYRLMAGKEVAGRYAQKIEMAVPESGQVNILNITDKQYENMVCFLGRSKVEVKKNSQLSLF